MLRRHPSARGAPRDSLHFLLLPGQTCLLSAHRSSGVCEEGSMGFRTRETGQRPPKLHDSGDRLTLSEPRAPVCHGRRPSHTHRQCCGPGERCGGRPPSRDECPPGGEASRVWRLGGHSQTVSQPWRTWLCLRLPPSPGPRRHLPARRQPTYWQPAGRAWRCSGEVLQGRCSRASRAAWWPAEG